MTEDKKTEEPTLEEPREVQQEAERATEDFQDKYFRLLAEVENTRKRMQKEKHEMTRFAVENVISEILLPIDTLENALGFTEQMSEEVKTWAKGFEMILAQFKEILSQHNIVPFHSEGQMFDPHKHEAVEVEETADHPDGTILHEFLKGYKSGDRVLRAARVKVAKPPAQEERATQTEENETKE